MRCRGRPNALSYLARILRGHAIQLLKESRVARVSAAVAIAVATGLRPIGALTLTLAASAVASSCALCSCALCSGALCSGACRPCRRR